MSWSNLNPYLVYALLGLLVFLILVAYVATREENPFSDLDTKKYSSTLKIKSTLLIPLAAWIDEQSDNFDEIADKLEISTEMLELIIKGRIWIRPFQTLNKPAVCSFKAEDNLFSAALKH